MTTARPMTYTVTPPDTFAAPPVDVYSLVPTADQARDGGVIQYRGCGYDGFASYRVREWTGFGPHRIWLESIPDDHPDTIRPVMDSPRPYRRVPDEVLARIAAAALRGWYADYYHRWPVTVDVRGDE